MDSESDDRAAPREHDVVEVIDPRTGYRVSAEVEGIEDGFCVLMFDLGAAVPEQARVHWDHGDAGWQTEAHFERRDETSARFRIGSASDWEPAPVRRSLRTPVANSPVLIRRLEEGSQPKHALVHAICLDVSDTGCRASWPGPAPSVGNLVELAWEGTSWREEIRPEWIPARVARVISMPFGGTHVGLQFDLSNAAQTARVRAWAHSWLQENRRRALLRRAS